MGFDNLTLATVAEQLQVAHSALYRHVADREDLVVLAMNRMLQLTPGRSRPGGGVRTSPRRPTPSGGCWSPIPVSSRSSSS
nr:hypothetical protein GCM10020093_022670 [Planobispora longispora]